jgi:TPR repeat protein
MSQAIREAKSAIQQEDYSSAIRLLRPLAESGIAEAQCLMASLHLSTEAIREEEACDWLQRAARQKYPAAFYYLFVIGHGDGKAQDAGRRALMIRAAGLGCADAQRDLGCFYATGDIGFPKDESSARHWYGMAAEQGQADAQYNYAFMLLLGEGGPADRQRAYAWFRKAAEAGQADARRFLNDNPYEKAEPLRRANRRQPPRSFSS